MREPETTYPLTLLEMEFNEWHFGEVDRENGPGRHKSRGVRQEKKYKLRKAKWDSAWQKKRRNLKMIPYIDGVAVIFKWV